jgi:hypothetical protein
MPGIGALMLSIDIDAALTYTIRGLIGILLIYGLSSFPAKEKTEVDRLLAENKNLKEKFKHTSGHRRRLEDENASLQNTLQREKDRSRESQLAREKLNGELVRRESQIRSLELALNQERNMARGGR